MNFYLLHVIKNKSQPLTEPALTLADFLLHLHVHRIRSRAAHLGVLRPLQ